MQSILSMNEPSPPSEQWEALPKTCCEVLEYLMEHPDAGDTMNGILQWWLLEQQIRESRSAMQAAVDLLVQRGWIIANLAEDSRWHYRLNLEKVQEIKDFLAARKPA